MLIFSPPHSVAGINPGIDNYVLSTGNICPRKNQLALVRACRSLGVPLLLAGNPIPGEEEYARVISEEMNGIPGMRWIKGLTAGSPELAMLYCRAALFALVSHEETQPISALEAVAAGKALLLADRPYAKQEFFSGVMTVNPKSIDAIKKGLKILLSIPKIDAANRNNISQCRFSAVGEGYANVFKKIAA